MILQQDVTNDDDWQTVCAAPCDKLLSTAFYYRIAGGGLKASGDFALHAQPGAHETLIVDGASKGSFALGIVALAAGIVAAYVGLIVVDVGFLQSSVDGGGGSDNGTVGAGVAVMVVGAVAALGGLLLTIANSRTKVKQVLGGDSSGLLLPGSWTPTPPWSASPTAQKGQPPTIGIPLFSGRF